MSQIGCLNAAIDATPLQQQSIQSPITPKKTPHTSCTLCANMRLPFTTYNSKTESLMRLINTLQAFIMALAVMILPFTIAPMQAFAQSACKGLSKSACQAKGGCSYVGAHTRSNGAKVKAFCRATSGNGSSTATKKKKKKTSSTTRSSSNSSQSTSSRSNSSSKKKPTTKKKPTSKKKKTTKKKKPTS